jgi:LPXTG-motif cell wall-anchored protein
MSVHFIVRLLLVLGLTTFGVTLPAAPAVAKAAAGKKTKGKPAPKSAKGKGKGKSKAPKVAAPKGKGGKPVAQKVAPKTDPKARPVDPNAKKKPVVPTATVETKPKSQPAEPALTDTAMPEDTSGGPWLEMGGALIILGGVGFLLYRRKKKTGGGADAQGGDFHSKAATAFGSSLSSLDLDKSKQSTAAKTLSQPASSLSKHG